MLHIVWNLEFGNCDFISIMWAVIFNIKNMADDYQFDDIDSNAPIQNDTASSAPVRDDKGGGYASELFSKQIKAKFRTFFIDLKESSNGKFIKVSEKSHGRKTTIMMDAEDVGPFIEALKEVQEQL